MLVIITNCHELSISHEIFVIYMRIIIINYSIFFSLKIIYEIALENKINIVHL